MNSEMIMKLVDEYAWRAHLDSNKEQTGKARSVVVAVIDALTKDTQRYLFLRDNFAANSSNDEFEFSELAKLNATGFDHKIDQEMEIYNASTRKPNS